MEALNRERGQVKSKVTRATGKIEALVVDEKDLCYFEESLASTDRFQVEYDEIRRQILAELARLASTGEKTSAELDALYEEQGLKLEEIQEGIVGLRSILKGIIKSKQPNPNPNS